MQLPFHLNQQEYEIPTIQPPAEEIRQLVGHLQKPCEE